MVQLLILEESDRLEKLKRPPRSHYNWGVFPKI